MQEEGEQQKKNKTEDTKEIKVEDELCRSSEEDRREERERKRERGGVWD